MNLVVVTVMDALSKNNVGLQTRNSKLEQENAWLQEMLKVRVYACGMTQRWMVE